MDSIDTFLASPAFAVAGASSQRHKYGNKVLRCYMQNRKTVYPVNPREKIIEGLACVPTLAELPASVKSLSIITPPAVTSQLVEQALAQGITNIWMQPGAESDEAIALCHKHKVNLIAGGPCLLVVLGYHE